MTIWTGIGYSWADAALTAPWMALLALACWATFWRPRVAVSDAGVRARQRQPRTIFIPWPALHDIDTKWSLTLITAYGRFTAWSAPAPGQRGALLSLGGSREEHGQRRAGARRRRGRPARRPGRLAVRVRGRPDPRRWDKVRARRSSRGPAVGATSARCTWHVARSPAASAAAALLAVGIVAARI